MARSRMNILWWDQKHSLYAETTINIIINVCKYVYDVQTFVMSRDRGNLRPL